jgi:hypothetical protein
MAFKMMLHQQTHGAGRVSQKLAPTGLIALKQLLRCVCVFRSDVIDLTEPCIVWRTANDGGWWPY